MEQEIKYNLVHITTGGEYKTPLVASQLFDQAEYQAIIKDGFPPEVVEAWIIGSMREYWDKEAQHKMNSLKSRCPHIHIRMINGVSRLGKHPIPALLRMSRRRLGKAPVIYHCRGEAAAYWAIALRQHFPGDKVVLDVRGYWPAELLYKKGIEYPEKATGEDLEAYNKARASLINIVEQVDAVTAVSQALQALLSKEARVPPVTAVVPCCVSHVTDDSRRAQLRSEWGIKEDEILLVYSGTTAAYQHLEDLTIPFMKKLASSNEKIRLAFFSSEHEQIKQLLAKEGMDADRIIVKGFPQKEVGAALTACDAGILIRKPTVVNAVANPVKIAEYLAAGLPIIIEKGVGGVSDSLFERSLLKGISITANDSVDHAAHEVNEWLRQDIKGKREQVRLYVKDVYLWSAAVHVSRRMYHSVLENSK